MLWHVAVPQVPAGKARSSGVLRRLAAAALNRRRPTIAQVHRVHIKRSSHARSPSCSPSVVVEVEGAQVSGRHTLKHRPAAVHVQPACKHKSRRRQHSWGQRGVGKNGGATCLATPPGCSPCTARLRQNTGMRGSRVRHNKQYVRQPAAQVAAAAVAAAPPAKPSRGYTPSSVSSSSSSGSSTGTTARMLTAQRLAPHLIRQAALRLAHHLEGAGGRTGAWGGHCGPTPCLPAPKVQPPPSISLLSSQHTVQCGSGPSCSQRSSGQPPSAAPSRLHTTPLDKPNQ